MLPTFWLDPESSKEVKAAPASLLTSYIPLFASQTRAPRSNRRRSRSLHSGRSLNAHQPRPIPFPIFPSLAFGIGYPPFNFQFSTFNLIWPNERGIKQIPSGALRNFGCLSEASFRNFSGTMRICSLWSVSLEIKEATRANYAYYI